MLVLAAPAPRGRYAGVSAQRCSCTVTVETILPVVRAGHSDVIVCSTRNPIYAPVSTLSATHSSIYRSTKTFPCRQPDSRGGQHHIKRPVYLTFADQQLSRLIMVVLAASIVTKTGKGCLHRVVLLHSFSASSPLSLTSSVSLQPWCPGSMWI